MVTHSQVYSLQFYYGCSLLILKGVETAAFINSIVTVAKLIPILVIICMLVAFNFETFKEGFFGMNAHGALPFNFGDTMSQVKSTMLVTVWVFIGIEGAVVFSSRAKRKKDVGTATAVIGLISVLLIYFLLTVLAQGVIIQNHISQLNAPSMAHVLACIVGDWGSTLVNIGLIISVLGAWLGLVLAGELPLSLRKMDYSRNGLLRKMKTAHQSMHY